MILSFRIIIVFMKKWFMYASELHEKNIAL